MLDCLCPPCQLMIMYLQHWSLACLTQISARTMAEPKKTNPMLTVRNNTRSFRDDEMGLWKQFLSLLVPKWKQCSCLSTCVMISFNHNWRWIIPKKFHQNRSTTKSKLRLQTTPGYHRHLQAHCLFILPLVHQKGTMHTTPTSFSVSRKMQSQNY